MKILFNASNLVAGGGLFAGLSVLQHWLQHPKAQVTALLSPALLHHLGDERRKLQKFEVVPDSPGSSLVAGRAFQQQAATFEKAEKPEVVFTPFGPPRWRPAAPHLCGFANGLYLTTKKAQPYGSRAGTLDRTIHTLKRAAVLYSLGRDTDGLWVETEGCKRELHKLLPKKKIAVVPNELNSSFPLFTGAAKPVGSPFKWFFPAAGYPHKNFALLRVLLQQWGAEAPFRFFGNTAGRTVSVFFWKRSSASGPCTT